MQSHSVKTWRHQLKAFKKSFVQLFHDYYVNQAETSVATYDKEYFSEVAQEIHVTNKQEV